MPQVWSRSTAARPAAARAIAARVIDQLFGEGEADAWWVEGEDQICGSNDFRRSGIDITSYGLDLV
jgi:hypothetical protein